ncbi:hypothetical protein F4824DRAFT_77719 [Ustulina deusta]|nr:hypothetical protein F4824DRAFT_77719 [Ustulina deusta]
MIPNQQPLDQRTSSIIIYRVFPSTRHLTVALPLKLHAEYLLIPETSFYRRIIFERALFIHSSCYLASCIKSFHVAITMSEKTKSISEGDGTTSSQPGQRQEYSRAKHTDRQEARVVSKLDWNLMTLFFALCELER